MRDWLLLDLQSLAARPYQRVLASKQPHKPPDIHLIVASTANTAQRCGRLGSAIMHLPESMDTTSAVAYLKQSGVTDEDAASDRVVSSLVVSSALCQSAAHSMIAILTSACRGERARAAEATKAWRMQFISCTSCGWLDRVPP